MTTTETPITHTVASTLQDYEIHLTGEQDLPPRHVWVPLTDHYAPPADNPEGWEDSFRGVPHYRPVNTRLDRDSRPWGSNGVEAGFVFLMLNGVWLTGVSLILPSSGFSRSPLPVLTDVHRQVSNWLWRSTGGRINKNIFRWKVGGEF